VIPRTVPELATGPAPAQPAAEDGWLPTRVTVLGSARLQRGCPEWDLAFRTGKRLAEEGWTVVTGGYDGLMGAAAQGAGETGGHVVGLPMRQWTHLVPNPANVVLDWNDSYGERVDKIASADAVVALPGGVGTLAEWALAWMSTQTENQPRVLVLVGERWSNLVSQLSSVLFADEADYAHLAFANEPDEVVDRIRGGLSRLASPLARG
jgi:uncharacterized protein (TIGR00730 family)